MAKDSYKLNIDVSVSQNAEAEIKSLETTVSGLNEKIKAGEYLLENYTDGAFRALNTQELEKFKNNIKETVSDLNSLTYSLEEATGRLMILKAQINQRWSVDNNSKILFQVEQNLKNNLITIQKKSEQALKGAEEYTYRPTPFSPPPQSKQIGNPAKNRTGKLQDYKEIQSKRGNITDTASKKAIEIDRFDTSTAKTRIAEVKQAAKDISKEFATTVNNKVNEWVNQLHSQGVSRVSSSKRAEMYEAAYADEYAKRKNTGNLVIPTGRTQSVWEYKEAQNKGVYPNAGVLTTRSYESFVKDGKFIPSSKYVVDENGIEGREYFKTLGVADERLRNKDKVGGLKSLYNASIEQIANAYEQLENLKNLETTSENVKKSIEKFQKDIIDAIVQSFANSKGLIDAESGLDEFQKMLSSRLFKTDSFNKNNYEELFGDVDYSKKGSLWDILRGQITDVTTPLQNRNNDDKTERWIENQTPDENRGRDNTSKVEQELLQQIKELTQKAEGNKDAQALVDLLNNKIEWTPRKTFSQNLKENPEDTIKIAKEVITQIIDILANGNVKNETKFDKDNKDADVYLGDAKFRNKEGNELTYESGLKNNADDEVDNSVEELVADGQTLLEDQAIQEAKISEMKESLKGALGYVSEWVKHVDEGYTDEQIDSLITQVEEIEEVGKTLSNDEINQLAPFLNKFSSDSNYAGNMPKVLSELHSIIEGIKSQRSIENEKEKEALTPKQKEEIIKSGGKFKNDISKEQELTNEIDQYYGQGWIDSVSKALEANAGELDDKAREFMTDILNSLFSSAVNLNTPEGNDLAKKLISVTHGDGGIVSLYNILSKMYEDSNTVDTSIKRKVDALNNATGNQGLYNFDEELAKWKEANPNEAKKYDRSKLMRETFDNNGGFLKVKSALEAVFNLDDYYLQQLGERWNNLNYDLTETFTKEEKQADGTVKKVKKTITENAQDIVIRGFEGRTTLLGVNPDSKSGQNYWANMATESGKVPEDLKNKLTPQQKTSLYYKWGEIGRAYGGNTPEEYLTNAQKQLSEKEKELAEASEEKATLLQAEITLIKSDIEKLTKATTRKNKDTSNVELIQTKKDVKPQKEEKKALTESKDAVYQRQKAQEQLRTDIKNFDAVGSTVKHRLLGEGKITALDLDKGRLTAKFGNKEEDYATDIFIKEITDYLPAVTKELGKHVGEESVKQAKNKKIDKNKLEDFSDVSGEANAGGGIGGSGTGNLFNVNEPIYINGKDILVDSTTSQVNSDKVQVETSNSEFTSNGKAIINLNGGEFTGSGSFSGIGDGSNNISPQTYTQFEKGVKFGGSTAFMVKDTDKGFYDAQGNRITGATTYIKDLVGWSVPEQEAKIKTLKDQISRLGEGESLKAEDTVFSQEEFEKLRHAANNSVRGEILHELLEEFAKSGKSVNEIGAELDTYINAFKETEKYKAQMAELSKWGLGEDFVNLKSSMESILSAMSLGEGKDLSFTKLAESAIGLKMSGNQGDVTVAARLDSLLSGLSGYAVNDWKSGYSGASAILQNSIERQALVSLYDSADEELKKFIQNLGINVEMLKKMSNEVLITQIGENGETNIVPAQATNTKNIYGLLAYRNNMILKGRGETLSPEEKQKYIGVAETWNARIGRASDFIDNSGEFIQPSEAEQNKAVNQYYSAWEKYIKEARVLLELKDELDNATDKEKENLLQRIDAQQEVVNNLKNFVPEFEKMTGQDENGNDVTLGYKVGNVLVSPDKVEGETGLIARQELNASQYRRQKIERQYAGIRGSSGSGIGGLKASSDDANQIINAITDQNKKFQSLFDMDAKDLYNFFDKTSWGNIDTSMGNIEEKFKVYKDSLNQIIKYTKDYVKNQTELEAIEKRISELKQKGYEDNSQEIQTLEREKKLREETLATVKEQINVAQKNKENTGLDKAARSGQLTNAQTKEYYDSVVNAQNKMSTELNNTRYKALTNLNLDTSKMGANQSIQEYLNAYKEELRLQEQIQALRQKMQSQDGEQLTNSKLYEQALTTQLGAVQQITQGYNAQTGTLNGIKLTSEEIQKITESTNKLDTQHQTNLAKINSQIKVQKNFLQEILDGFKQSFVQFSGANVAFEIIQRIKQGISEVIQITKELDADLVDLQIASGATREEMYSMLDSFADLGNQLGRTTRDISEAANDWLRAGYEGKEATELIRASAQLSTLGMINTSDATSYLISVLKGWKLEAKEVSEVVDKLTAVDMAAAQLRVVKYSDIFLEKALKCWDTYGIIKRY